MEIIETVDKDNKKLKLVMKPLGHKILQEAQMVYNVKLTSLIKQSVSEDTKLLSRQQLEQHIATLGIWTEDDDKQFLKLQLELRSLELMLKSGGIKISEAKNIALKMKMKRAILLVLYNRHTQFDGITMESIADNEKFKFLITKCIMVAENDVPLFINIEDYEARQEEQAAIDAATTLASRLYGYDQHAEDKLVENQWLKQFEFADNQGRLINKDDKLIDIQGRLINENGRFIDEQGNLIDNKGRPVDEDGNFIVDTKPFIDDDTGKPVVLKQKQKQKKKKSKKSNKKSKG